MRTRIGMIVVLLMLALGAQAQGQKLAEPPFVRRWTAMTGDNLVVIAVRSGVVYYCSQKGVGALDLATGQSKWNCLESRSVPAAALIGSHVYALTPTEKKTDLQTIDSVSGHTRVLASLPSAARFLRADADHVYVLDNSGKVWAFHPTSGAVLWTRQILPSAQRGLLMAQLQVTPKGVYVALAPSGEYGLSRKDGAILWHHAAQYATLNTPLVYGDDIISCHETLQRIAMPSGHIVWQKKEAGEDGVLVGNVLVGVGEKSLEGRSVANGEVLWRLPLADAESSYVHMEEHLKISDGEQVWLDREPVVCVTRGGREVWHRAKPFTGNPVYANREYVVVADYTRILGYARGTLPALPTSAAEKENLAQRLAAQYEILDDAERKQLDSLAPYAFPLLLQRYVRWAQVHDADKEGKQGMELYRVLTDVPVHMLAACRKEDTPAIVSAWSTLGEKSSWRDTLERLLMAKGDPAGYIPILVKHLRKARGQQREDSAALTAVSHSSHPDAVAFMLEALRDPAAPSEWRHEAFVHLAGVGGQEGVDAVRAARRKQGASKPWFERIDLDHLDKRAIVGTRKDAKGRTWMLFHSGVLGNYSDLFVVEKADSGWKRPLFTGAWTGGTFHQDAPKTFRGIPIATLLSTAWIKIFPDDPVLRKDTDGDGLTDLVEARLGTDPARADTDGDGLSDLVDPCPTAAPRPLGDTEQIVAACLEARFFAEGWETPAVLSAEGVKPFELYGYASTVLWETPGRKIPLADLYGGGVNMISFQSDERTDKGQKSFIRYSADHKTAYTLIRRYSGGLNGDGIAVTLRKIGAEWFVIDLQMQYVS